MAANASEQRAIRWYHPRWYRNGVRARVLLPRFRERGIHDPVHGILPDRRPLPSAWTLGITLLCNTAERRIKWFVEEYLTGMLTGKRS